MLDLVHLLQHLNQPSMKGLDWWHWQHYYLADGLQDAMLPDDGCLELFGDDNSETPVVGSDDWTCIEIVVETGGVEDGDDGGDSLFGLNCSWRRDMHEDRSMSMMKDYAIVAD